MFLRYLDTHFLSFYIVFVLGLRKDNLCRLTSVQVDVREGFGDFTVVYLFECHTRMFLFLFSSVVVFLSS